MDLQKSSESRSPDRGKYRKSDYKNWKNSPKDNNTIVREVWFPGLKATVGRFTQYIGKTQHIDHNKMTTDCEALQAYRYDLKYRIIELLT